MRWSTIGTGDEAPTGAFSVGNLGAAVDAAFRTAVKSVAAARAAATVPTVPAAPPAPALPAPPAPASTYLLVPLEQPGIADPRASDMTHSLFVKLQKDKHDVKPGAPIDHFTAVANAPRLCSDAGAQAIIVPDVRVEQSSFTGRSHAALRLTLLSCGGAVLGHGAGEADMGRVMMMNFGAAIVGVSERAMEPAIEQLFASTAK